MEDIKKSERVAMKKLKDGPAHAFATPEKKKPVVDEAKRRQMQEQLMKNTQKLVPEGAAVVHRDFFGRVIASPQKEPARSPVKSPRKGAPRTTARTTAHNTQHARLLTYLSNYLRCWAFRRSSNPDQGGGNVGTAARRGLLQVPRGLHQRRAAAGLHQGLPVTHANTACSLLKKLLVNVG